MYILLERMYKTRAHRPLLQFLSFLSFPSTIRIRAYMSLSFPYVSLHLYFHTRLSYLSFHASSPLDYVYGSLYFSYISIHNTSEHVVRVEYKQNKKKKKRNENNRINHHLFRK